MTALKPIGAWQCLDCLDVERCICKTGRHKSKRTAIRALKRRCYVKQCYGCWLYYSDGVVAEATP